ncbi:MAG: type II secretion system protein [Phycisphaeraceae bacterium]|nr:type II secretion system protein [Phycisphaeraceae bacterium]
MRSVYRAGFTIIELLVVVSIIALLIAILMPAIGKARDQAKITQSLGNLRQLGVAHNNYASAFAGRQFTLVNDSWSRYGANAIACGQQYYNENANWHPPIILGWAAGQGGNNDSGGNRFWAYWIQPPNMGNAYRLEPISFSGTLKYFGAFRIPNAKQFRQYVSDRFYDPVFYAPKDVLVVHAIDRCLEAPYEFCTEVAGVNGGVGWSSYCLSPAALFAADILRNDVAGGYRNPYMTQTGFKVPPLSQARYPTLKTHMLEHHWLQNRPTQCNPAFQPGNYSGCEPYYFNHGWESQPNTLFFDGSVRSVGTRRAEQADGRSMSQSGHGLWVRNTPFGTDGYLIGSGYDFSNTSYHILTADGILGRDFVAD